MKKFFSIAAYEYCRHVFRFRFFFFLFSLPLFTAFAFLVIYLIVQTEQEVETIGFVDHANIIRENFFDNQSAVSNTIIRFGNEHDADQALQNNQIKAYFVFERDYKQTGKLRLTSEEPLNGFTVNQFANFIRKGLLHNQSKEIVNRINQGNQIVIRSLDGSRDYSKNDQMKLLFPIMLLFIFLCVQILNI